MSEKESQLHNYFQQVQAEKLSLVKVSEFIGIGYRQIKRLWKKFKEEGIKGLISKKRGGKGNRQRPENFYQQVLELIENKYRGCKPLFTTEKLNEEHKIIISKETVRKLMIENHLWFPKIKKTRLHQRRKCRACEGELVQIDASDHLWFEERGPKCHLHILVDDATSRIKGGYFAKEETTLGYYEACKPYFESEGCPLSLYSDKRGTFKVNTGNNRGITQFQQAMRKLDINLIFAHSPQAKGRVERVFGTLQDRLVCELRLRHISTMEEANRYLPDFIKAYNAKFGHAPRNSFNAHRHLSTDLSLKYILAFREERTLTKNLETSYECKIYQIQADDSEQKALKRATVEVIRTMEGEIRFEYKGKVLKFKVFGEDFQEYQKSNPSVKINKSPAVRIQTPWRNTKMCPERTPKDENEQKIVDIRLAKRRQESRYDNLNT